jgi:hypothetical protein
VNRFPNNLYSIVVYIRQMIDSRKGQENITRVFTLGGYYDKRNRKKVFTVQKKDMLILERDDFRRV